MTQEEIVDETDEYVDVHKRYLRILFSAAIIDVIYICSHVFMYV